MNSYIYDNEVWYDPVDCGGYWDLGIHSLNSVTLDWDCKDDDINTIIYLAYYRRKVALYCRENMYLPFVFNKSQLIIINDEH